LKEDQLKSRLKLRDRNMARKVAGRKARDHEINRSGCKKVLIGCVMVRMVHSLWPEITGLE
jgi:hypothetical protein